MNLTMSERRMINLFKTFIEKVFVPFIPKMDPFAQKQWNNFSKMLTGDSFNYGEVQLYVDTLSMPNQTITPNVYERNRNKSPINSANNRKDSINEGSFSMPSFNPSKTFGGQRARIALQMNLENESTNFGVSRESKQTSIKEQKNMVSTLSLQPTLQKLFKLFNENQQRIEKMSMMGQNGGKMYG